LLFIGVAGLKMTPVTLEGVIDASKRERKLGGDMATMLRVPVAALHFESRLRAPSRVNENARASLMNGELDE
jgi:hypothetical protein